MRHYLIKLTLNSIIILFISNLSYGQTNRKVQKILTKSIQATNKIKTLKGVLSINVGSPSPESDISISQMQDNFIIKRVEEDTITGFYFTEDLKEYKMFYNGENCIWYDKQENNIEKGSAKEAQGAFIYSTLHTNLIGNVKLYLDRLTLVDSIFAKQERSWLIGNISMLKDTLINNLNCYLILNRKNGETKKFNRTYSNEEIIAIDKETFVPIYARTHFQRITNGKIDINQVCYYKMSNLIINTPVNNNVFTFNKQIVNKPKKTLNKLSVGDTMPNLQLSNLKGKKVLLKSLLKGKVTVLEFGYIGCGACIFASNELNEAHRLFKGNKKVKFYYINPINSPEKFAEYLKGENFLFDALIGNKKTVEQVGLDGYPMIFIINPKMQITKIFNGYTGKEMSDKVYKEIKRLLK